MPLFVYQTNATINDEIVLKKLEKPIVCSLLGCLRYLQ